MFIAMFVTARHVYSDVCHGDMFMAMFVTETLIAMFVTEICS